MQKPKVERITGLSPAISIEQKTTSKSPRSTVGTVTEVYDYLRILFARLGERHCPSCDRTVGTQSADEIVDKVLSLPMSTKLYIMAPLERKAQEKYDALWEEIRAAGYTRMRVTEELYIDEPPSIDHRRRHSVEVVVDRTSSPVLAHESPRPWSSVRPWPRVVHRYVDADRESNWKVDRFLSTSPVSIATSAER